jgi:type VI secretion system protein ImpK
MAHSDDPFDPFSSSNANDRTIIRPVPGGRRKDLEDQIKNTSPPETEHVNINIPLHNLGNLNALESAASALLALISRLYNSPSHDDPNGLQKQLITEISTFTNNAAKAGYDASTINDASYALCTTLDEAIFHTPWGQDSGWSEQSLLSHFHDDIAGGRQFFYKLNELGQNPAKHIDLLELKSLCMALGFQGQYRLEDAGTDKLLSVREKLVQLIRQQRGSSEALLSPHWQGVVTQQNSLIRVIPIWVFFAVAGALLLALFMGLFTALNAASNPVKTAIAKLEVQEAPIRPKINQIQAIKAKLPSEIKQHYIDVRSRDKDGRTLVELLGKKGLFASGSDRLTKKIKPVVEKIAAVLASADYAHHSIRVIGHTDNVPIKNSIRFADNFALSKARANTVKALLISSQPSLKQRISVQGKGDVEPLDTRSTRAARAKNRRVEIILD